MLDFDLRSRIRSGEVQSHHKLWFTELEEWTPIGEVALFANEFEVEGVKIDGENVEGYLAELEEELESRESTPPTPPPLPPDLHLWRRFGGRWFDYLGYMAVFFVWIAWTGADLKALHQRALFPVVLILPWMFLEAASLHYWGTTPGKWLVGLRVRDASSRKLSPGMALFRTMRVMILGMGFGQVFLREFCHLVALWFAVKRKVVLWDASMGIRLERAPESPQKWIAFGVGILMFISVSMAAGLKIAEVNPSPEEKAGLAELQKLRDQLFNPEKK